MFNASFIDESEQITEERFSAMNLPNVFYLKIEQVSDFIFNYCPRIDKPFYMVTHRGDMPVQQTLLSAVKQNPLFVKWFGQNIDCDPDPKLTSIPIGLENDLHNPDVKKRLKIREASMDAHKDTPRRLAYMNFSFWTYRVGRIETYDAFKDKSWVTNDCLEAVIQTQYSSWIENVRDHHYVICPRGNGIDTHRMWETLYLGRIPIVKRCRNTEYYSDLPILQVDSWDQITEQLLEEKLAYFSNPINFKLDMLRFSWWKDFIKRG